MKTHEKWIGYESYKQGYFKALISIYNLIERQQSTLKRHKINDAETILKLIKYCIENLEEFISYGEMIEIYYYFSEEQKGKKKIKTCKIVNKYSEEAKKCIEYTKKELSNPYSYMSVCREKRTLKALHYYNWFEHFYNEYNDENGTTRAAGFYIVDDDVSFNEGKYVLTFYPNGNKNDTIFTDAFYLFPADKTEGIEQTDVWSKWELKNYPDYKNGYYQLKEKDISFTTNLKFYVNDGIDENGEIRYVIKDFPTEIKSIEVSENNIKWQDIGLSFKTIKTWLPFGDRIVGTFEDFGNASVAIIQGIGSLFTGGIKNMSGIVGIFSTSSQIYSQFTFSYYLYFWGLISVNLAIFNLLPFPGLDGWQLLVTAIEGSVNAFKRHKYKRLNGGFVNGFQEWKIPNKIKNIVSFIGLGLLFVLMIAILIMDIIRLF